MTSLFDRKRTGLRPATAPILVIGQPPGAVIHCTAGGRPTSLAQAIERWRQAQHYHQTTPSRGGRGWKDIGYHYGVTPTGEILLGRVDDRGRLLLGAHAKGHNRWLGITVLGKGLDLTTEEREAIEWLCTYHGVSQVVPHNTLSRKSCPGPAVTQWVRERWGGAQ